MRLVYVKILTGLSVLAGFGLLLSAWQTATAPIADLATQSADPLPSPRPQAPITVSIARPDALAISLERPLFRPDRRPFDPGKAIVLTEPPPPPAPPEPEPPPPAAQTIAPAPVFPQLALRGVHITRQSDAALIETPGFPLGSWMTVGSVVLDWRLTSISPDRVTFASGDQTQTLKLYVDNPTNSIGNPQQQQ